NFDISINKRIGMDNGVRIAYGKNLTGLEEEINFEEVVTRAVPVGADGLMLDEDKPWVDSELINNYANIKMRVVNYDDVKVKENPDDEEGFNTIEEARAELIKRVKSDYEKGMDKPLVNYKVEFLDLSKIEEYKNYKILEETLLGDTVHISHKRLNIDIEARVIKIEYNPLTGKMESIELGNYLNSYAKEKADNSITINNIDNSFDYNGDLKGSNINGAINAIKAPLIAQKDAAKKSDVVATLSEITDPSDPNFGANMSGTKGIMIANKRTPDNRDWQWGTAISADGIVADKLIGKILAGNGAYFDLERGIIFFNKGKIQGSNSSWDLDKGIINFTKGLIQGGSSSWNLDDGEIKFSKGRIDGVNCFWDLNRGIFNTEKEESGRLYSVKLEGGQISSNNYFKIFCSKAMDLIANEYVQVKGSNRAQLASNSCNVNVADKIFANGSVIVSRDLKVTGNKNCIQTTKEFGDVPFYSNEDINSLISKTDIDNVYETKLQSTGTYKCIVTINQMIRECINTDSPYNIYILNKMDFGEYRISGQYPGYFVVESKVPIRFKYKLEGRRKGFEDMNEQLVFEKAYKTKIKPKEVV
ncbi:MAG: phage tail spike protein, partial [Clostridium sp.]|uniref:phage tail spike protein n=1 Tax=Clostridium sp. TaxID=1506 RepID=UPI003F343633